MTSCVVDLPVWASVISRGTGTFTQIKVDGYKKHRTRPLLTWKLDLTYWRESMTKPQTLPSRIGPVWRSQPSLMWCLSWTLRVMRAYHLCQIPTISLITFWVCRVRTRRSIKQEIPTIHQLGQVLRHLPSCSRAMTSCHILPCQLHWPMMFIVSLAHFVPVGRRHIFWAVYMGEQICKIVLSARLSWLCNKIGVTILDM